VPEKSGQRSFERAIGIDILAFLDRIPAMLNTVSNSPSIMTTRAEQELYNAIARFNQAADEKIRSITKSAADEFSAYLDSLGFKTTATERTIMGQKGPTTLILEMPIPGEKTDDGVMAAFRIVAPRKRASIFAVRKRRRIPVPIDIREGDLEAVKAAVDATEKAIESLRRAKLVYRVVPDAPEDLGRHHSPYDSFMEAVERFLE
jgi:hypothetical protein